MSSKSLAIKVSPEVLKWTRDNVRISIEDAAKKINVDVSTFESWEQTGGEIGIVKLRELANAYKLPWAVFLLKEPLNKSPIPKDFRTLPIEDGKVIGVSFTKKTLLAIEKAARIQELAAELGDEIDYNLGEKIETVNLANANPDSLAISLREKLGISIEHQLNWKDEKEALKWWINIIEKKKLLILQLPMNVKEVRGFSIYGDGKKPHIIGINNSDAAVAKIFSIFHEYAHLILSESGVKSVDRAEVNFDSKIKTIEKFCNQFAGSFLVPKDSFLKDKIVATNRSKKWDERSLSSLSRKFKVSKEVILRRLLYLDQTTQDFFEEKRKEWREKELNIPKKKGGGKRDMPKEVIRENGRTFTGMVLQGGEMGKLSYGQISDYLQVKVKHLPAIIELMSSS